MHRRKFFRHALRGAAGAAMFASSALHTKRIWGANDRIVLGVMGVHGRGKALAAGFARQPGVDVAYLCDVDREALAKAASELREQTGSEATGIEDFRHILDDTRVDALVIATPDHWHALATILACAAGKHVYVEKPACHNGQEGVWMVESARLHGKLVQIGTQRRSSPGIREALQRLREGEIGRVLFARGWINSTRPSIGHGQVTAPPAFLNYSLWQGPAPERPYRDNVIHYHWHWFWHWGTGELGNNGIHAVDVCRWGLGVDSPTRVVCGGGKLHFQDDQETPDTQLATFHFPGGKLIHWEHRTWHRRGFEDSLFGVLFYGEQGTLRISDSHATFFDMDGKESESSLIGGGETEHLSNFLDAVRGGAPLSAEIEEGVASTALCHLGNIAYRVGRTIDLDPVTGAILNDPEADKLWRREYRPGWEPAVA